jgi:hypothetical protein
MAGKCGLVPAVAKASVIFVGKSNASCYVNENIPA